LSEGDQIRDRYIEAMKSADQEDYRQLIAFMKALAEEKVSILFPLSVAALFVTPREAELKSAKLIIRLDSYFGKDGQ